MTGEQSPVLRLIDGIRFIAGQESWQLDPLKITPGTWVALVPVGTDPTFDPSHTLA